MTIAAAAMALSIGGSIMGFVGSIQQGQAAKASADFNAQMVNQDRIQSLRNNEIAQEDKRREDTRRLAGLRASFGSSGLDMTGSPLDVLQDTSTEMALDENRIGYQGQVKNREQLAQMSQYSAEGSNALKAGYIQGFGSLLSGGSSATKTYLENYA